MVAILVLIGFGALGLGFLSLTQATMGAGFIGVACFFGIFARLVQAQDHQKETRRLLTKIAGGDMPIPPPWAKTQEERDAEPMK